MWEKRQIIDISSDMGRQVIMGQMGRMYQEESLVCRSKFVIVS